MPQRGATLKWSGSLSMNGRYRWRSGKESACQCWRSKRCLLDPRIGKIPWSRKQQPTPVFLPGKSHGQRSLVGYSPRNWRAGHGWARSQAASCYGMQLVRSPNTASKLLLPSAVSVPDKAHHLFHLSFNFKNGAKKKIHIAIPRPITKKMKRY